MWWILAWKFLAATSIVFIKYFINLGFDIYEYFEDKLGPKK